MFFTFLVDETADVSKYEQMSVCLHVCYCSLLEYSVEEDFVGFVGTRDTNYETVAITGWRDRS